MPRAEAYGSSFVCLSVSHYAEGGATEAYCNHGQYNTRRWIGNELIYGGILKSIRVPGIAE